MKAGFSYHGLGAHLSISPAEVNAYGFTALVVLGTIGHFGHFVWKSVKKTQTKYKIEEEKAKSENKINEMRIRMVLKKEQKQNASSQEEGSVNDTNAEEYVPDLCDYDDAFGNDVPLDYIIEPLVTAGNINVLLGCAGVGKSIAMVQIAWAASTGKEAGLTSEKENVSPRATIFYRCEEYQGEFDQKYGNAQAIKASGIKFMTKSKMKNPTMKGLLDEMSALAMTRTQDTFICIDSVSCFPDYNPGVFMTSLTTVIEAAKKRGITFTFLISAHYEELENHKPLDTTKIVGGDEIIRKAGSVFAIRHERTGEQNRFIQILKEPKGTFLPKNEVFVEKIEVMQTDNENRFTHLKYVCKKDMNKALPFKNKAEEEEDGSEQKRSRSENLEWTEDMDDRLRKLAKEGISQRGIAKNLTSEFGESLKVKQIYATQVKTRADLLGIELGN